VTTAVVSFDDLLGLGLAPRTAYLYARMIDRVGPMLADRHADLLTATPVDMASIADLFPRTHSQRQMLRSAMLAAWEVLDRPDPPVRALRVPPRPKGRCRALSEGGARQLEAKAWELQHEDQGLAVLVGLYAGLRRAEIASLRWEDVLLGEQGRPEWIRVRGKGDVEADVPVHPVLAGVLERQRRSAGWLFPGKYLGRPVSPSTVWFWTRQVATAAGLPHVPTHVMRHTMLAEVNDRSHDLRAAQQIARHSRPETTAEYTRTKAARLREVVAMVDYGRRSA
jgi:integrase